MSQTIVSRKTQLSRKTNCHENPTLKNTPPPYRAVVYCAGTTRLGEDGGSHSNSIGNLCGGKARCAEQQQHTVTKPTRRTVIKVTAPPRISCIKLVLRSSSLKYLFACAGGWKRGWGFRRLGYRRSMPRPRLVCWLDNLNRC